MLRRSLLAGLAPLPFLLSAACSKDENAPSADAASASAWNTPQPSASAPPPPEPLSTAPALARPAPIPAATIKTGMPGVTAAYAQPRGPGDEAKLVGVNRETHEAVIELRRPVSGAPPQVLRVHLGRGELVDAWSPTHVLGRVTAPGNRRGPELADALNGTQDLWNDLQGWANRMAAAGPPWADDLLASNPGGNRFVFTAGVWNWTAMASHAGIQNLGPAGHARMTSDGHMAAWVGVADRIRGAVPKVLVVDFDAGMAPFSVEGVVLPQELTWSVDGKTLYAAGVSTADGGGERCLFAIDPRAHKATSLTCQPGGERSVSFSPSTKLAVIAALAPEPSKVHTDLTFVSLPDGAVKKQIRVPVEGREGILDDDGVYAFEAHTPAPLLVVVEMASGKKTIAKEVGDPLVVGGWLGKRSFVGLRTANDVLRVDRVDVDGLTSTAVPPPVH